MGVQCQHFWPARGAIVGGRLADAIGRKRVLVTSMIAFGIFSLGSALVHTVEPLILMRLLTGWAWAGQCPTCSPWLRKNSPSDRRGLAIAIMYCGMPFGGALASFTSIFDAVSWQQIFYIGGFAPLLAAPLLAWVLPESRGFQALQHADARNPRQACTIALQYLVRIVRRRASG